MKQLPLRSVSIVIPTFNRAEYLRVAIESSLSQTSVCEVIVCNHGSTDHTDDVVAEFGEQVTYVKRAHDFGPHFCWLDGIVHANGEFIHLQFDDDWIKPRFVEDCMSVMTAETGFVFSSAELFVESEQKVTQKFFSNWFPKTGIYYQSKIRRTIERSLISPAAAIYRKNDLIDALYLGKLPLSKNHYHGVGPDCLVTLLCLLRYPKLGFVSEPLAVFRSHDGSITISAQANKKRREQIKMAYKEVRRYYRELKLLKKLRFISNLLPRR